jgi:diketogulonate reductase-like aldo/keto reductase
VTPQRIKENLNLFDFELSSAEMRQIEGMDEGRRIAADPDTADFK